MPSVSNRVGEIGTLRALGFQRRTVLAAFLLESLLLSSIGGLIGLLAALVDAMADDFNHELANIFGAGLQLYPTPGIVLNSSCLPC